MYLWGSYPLRGFFNAVLLYVSKHPDMFAFVWFQMLMNVAYPQGLVLTAAWTPLGATAATVTKATP